MQAETRLAFAILNQAYLDVLELKSLDNSRKKSAVWLDVYYWFFDPIWKEENYLFTFENICAILDIHAQTFRRLLYEQVVKTDNYDNYKHAIYRKFN